MSKKLLYAILAGVLSISVLAACGGTEDPASGDQPAVEDTADEAGEEEAS